MMPLARPITVVTFLTLLLWSAVGRADQGDYWFEQVFHTGSYNMGIMQDREGFLWFTTTGGLIRYDGYEKFIFSEGEDGLTSNFVPSVFEDSEGLIWIVTLSGLDRYDKSDGSIRKFQPAPKPGSIGSKAFNWAPRLIAEDRDGGIWIASRNGLFRYEKSRDSFVPFRHDPADPTTLSSNDVWTVMTDRRDRVWIGTARGLDRYDRKTGRFTRFLYDPGRKGSLGKGVVYTVYEDRDGVIWVGTGEGGLNRYREEDETFSAYIRDPDLPGAIAHNEVFSITEDRAGNLWLGRSFSTSVGLEKFDRAREKFVLYTHNPKKDGTLSGNIVLTCFEDRSGILWVPENTGTVNKHDPFSHRFDLHRADPDVPETRALSGLASIYEDSRGDIWAGGQLGLSRLGRATGTWSTFTVDPDDPRALWNNYAFSVLEDSDGDFWVATDDGYLNLFDRERGIVVERYRNPHANNTARQIIEDASNPGRFWFGVEGYGLYSFDKKTGIFKEIKSKPNDPQGLGNEYVQTLLQDGAGTIWVQTQGGLYHFDPRSETFGRYVHDPQDPHSISGDVVNDIFLDRDGNYWVSTDRGLNRFDPASGAFFRFGQEHGFTTRSIRAIVQDDIGNLWLGSNEGLFVFDPLQEKVLHNYTREDGLQGDSFSLFGCSAIKARDGRLWFVGLGGANSFDPAGLKHNITPPPVRLSQLSQGGDQLVSPFRVGKIEEITLNWRHNYFEFEYVGLNFSQSLKNKYKYRLNGWDSDWYFAGNRRFGRYSGLSGGTYTLEILASNNDGVWSETPAVLTVHVGAPFWQTWWFYSLAAAVVFSLLGLFYFVRIRQLTNFNRELENAYLDVRKAENNYRSIFENAIFGIFQLAPDGTILSANPAAAAILGFAGAEELQAELTDIRDRIVLTARQRRALLVRLLKKGSVTDCELRVKTKNNREIWLSVNLSVIHDEDGRRQCIEGLMEDISTKKEASEQLRLYREHLEHLVDERTRKYQEMNLNLQKEIRERERVEEELLRSRKLESIGVLAGGIAHDFNNLLTVVVGNISIARTKLGTTCAEELDRAIQGVHRASDLTQKFITFSSGGDPVKQVVDIAALTRSAVELSLSGSNVQADFAIDYEPHRVSVDESHIRQAMHNIIENSKQAMPEGGKLTVRVRNCNREENPEMAELPIATGDYVAIEFIDTGSGIMPEHLSKVFDPYFTTAGMGAQKGKGLGLTIAYSIMKKHGGYLSLDSMVGKGTAVRMLLPAVIEAESACVRTDEPTRNSGKVLVMDDEEMLREVARDMLSMMGCQVTLAADGISAVELYKQALAKGQPFDAVFLDLTIPGGMGGREVVKILGNLDPGLKAIVSSGYANDPVVADYRRFGFVDALSKPYDMEGLRETLSRVLDSRRRELV